MIAEQLFGPIRQLAYVVPSIDEAIEAWNTQLGVGPFAVARDVQPLVAARYRGEPSGEVRLNLGFAYLDVGDLQLELIEQCNDTPSIYREACDRGFHGLHHYAFWVDDFASAYAHAMDHGFEAIVDVGVPGVAQMSYVESRRIPGLICELIEWNDLTRPYFDGVRCFLSESEPGSLVYEMDLAAMTSGAAS